MDIEELLREEIEREIGKLDGMDPGTNEYKAMVDGIAKLTERLVDLNKIKLEQQKQIDNRTDVEKERDLKKEQITNEYTNALFDRDFKQKQMEEDRKDRLIKNCIAVAGIVIPSVLTIWGTVKSFQFEKDGSITTIMGRGFINKLLPKK